MNSGDLCSFGREPVPAYYVTHYRCVTGVTIPEPK